MVKNIEVKLYQNTVWLNQKQLVELFDSSKSNISEHIKHIFEENELDEEIDLMILGIFICVLVLSFI